MEYCDYRNAVADTFACGTQKAKTTNLKAFTAMISFLQQEHIDTPEELTKRISDLEDMIREKKELMEEKSAELSLAREGVRAWDEYQKMRPIYNNLNQKKIFREKYREEHKSELSRYYRARRVLQENQNSDGKVDVKAWEREKNRLPEELAALKKDKNTLLQELKSFQSVQRSIEFILNQNESANIQNEEISEKEQKKINQRDAAKPKKKRSRGMEL
jgi:hypothetical protein